MKPVLNTEARKPFGNKTSMALMRRKIKCLTLGELGLNRCGRNELT
jgi:hypothetical protein